MMHSAEEFVQLRQSHCQSDCLRAATDSATVDVWLDVIRRFPEMKVWVAHNKTVQPEILIMLASDPDSKIRAAVAMKNNLPDKLFAVLACDADDFVRERISYNKKTPAQILRRLSQDSCKPVAAQARKRLTQSE